MNLSGTNFYILPFRWKINYLAKGVEYSFDNINLLVGGRRLSRDLGVFRGDDFLGSYRVHLNLIVLLCW